METAFGWIGKIVEFLLSILPTIYTVDADAHAVKCVRGKRPVVKGPGVHLYWPLVTNPPEIIQTNRRTNQLPAQRLTTADGFTVVISLVVIGRVINPLKAVIDTMDFDDDILSACQSAATPVVLGSEWHTLTNDITSGEFQKQVRRKIVAACTPYGFKVDKVLVSDWCETKVYSFVGDAPGVVNDEAD